MPTVLTHSIVGIALAAKSRGLHAHGRGRLLLACALCGMLPDVDYIGFKLGVQYNTTFGHRGFTHSFFFAALVAAGLSWLLYRRLRGGPARFASLFLLLFAVTASHPFLDAMTDGGEGVALFSPFSNHRYFFPYRPIMVSPLGVAGFFNGWRSLWVLVNELLLVISPLFLVLYLPEHWAKPKARKPVLLSLLALWGLLIVFLTGLRPLNSLSMTLPTGDQPVIDLFVKQYKNPWVLTTIPTSGIAGGRLVTNFGQLQRKGLFNRRLESADAPDHWASGFFPNWFGGIAGRWQDPSVSLFFRTVFGYGVASPKEILEVLKESMQSPAKKNFLFQLSPTEKYDLALGDYNFAATKSILAQTHNATDWPRFWYGICNGMAAASKWYREPFRAVDVINPNGFKIRFHPNDVKALLGYALANAAQWTEVGTRCAINGPEAQGCRVNPGAFLLATMNRLGLAHDGFIVDGFSGTRKQFYLFDAARVEVVQKPVPVSELQNWALPTRVSYLTRVRFTMEFVSTLLDEKEAAAPDLSAQTKGFYKKVGRVVVPRVLEALIALDQDAEVIGGSWLGEDDVPDVIFFPSSLPAMDEFQRLKMNPTFYWLVLKQLYDRSVSGDPSLTPLDLSL